MQWGNHYTWLGLSSILIWASLVGIVKLVTEVLSPVQGVALIYTFSAVFILVVTGLPRIAQMSKVYLLGCGALFVAYEILFLVSIALSQNRDQVMVIAMINYLWPPLMIVFSILLKQLNFHWCVGIGFLLAILGLMLVVNPDILNSDQLILILKQNPIAYLFALVGALLWPIYSILTKKYAQGQNGVPLFFTVTVVLLWLVHGVLNEPFVMPSLQLWLTVAVLGGLIGIAYSNWNQSMQYGHMKILIVATYFMPILSTVMSMLILGVYPQLSFWLGTGLVSLGAIICWKSTASIE
ncbi:aromatic amino acid transporter [Acinetobacter sp. TGL-Y2]|uniref:aromatic amino acid DMT transporter YddG n=1 Tax=Acinetobacter sp. TGL-Y2 TaxID=1407071 RepID=UPI0007A66DD4|nr:aromatic amino acid DMT transporter YddG [Acinetobacter sp. TGL-Y2]AMW79870.1 aromatic amino acid transporter [Acinetobacter sp. TGL-Y2]